MDVIANIFTGLTCVLQSYFFILEMFLWTTPFGLRTFGMKVETARSSAVLAANQGLYNGLLALGLLMTFVLPDVASAMSIRLYCLSFVAVVGCYGAYSLKNLKVFYVQSLPAIIALVAHFIVFYTK